jgi:hypothetical protein
MPSTPEDQQLSRFCWGLIEAALTKLGSRMRRKSENAVRGGLQQISV